MKKTIFGCTMLIIATMFLLINHEFSIAGIIYFLGLIFVLWGSIPENGEKLNAILKGCVFIEKF
ncbi:MAG: hypothetical protein ABF633_14190 [Clostridium sp.]|uniref:hypothetical protein n=1 Tax=Clostridium sp. TaxID=1506 RepID=UPI0039E9495E